MALIDAAMASSWYGEFQACCVHVTVLEPNSPTIGAATVTKKTLEVTWTAPYGTVEYYEVKLKEKSGTKRNVTKERTSVTFYGLSAGTKYTVLLVAVSGGQRSTTAEGSFYTSKCVLVRIEFLSRIT